MVMIGLPICMITALLTLRATVDVTVEEGLSARLGSAAAVITGPFSGVGLPVTRGAVEVQLDDGYERVHALEVDLRDSLSEGMRVLADGRFPATPGEVVVDGCPQACFHILRCPQNCARFSWAASSMSQSVTA